MIADVEISGRLNLPLELPFDHERFGKMELADEIYVLCENRIEVVFFDALDVNFR